MVLTRMLEVWYNKKFVHFIKITNFSTFASIYSNRDSCYNAFVRQLYRKKVIFMKKFLVPVSYVVCGKVEIESESIEKLIDDMKNRRIDFMLPNLDEVEYSPDSEDFDPTCDIVDIETNERYEWY